MARVEKRRKPPVFRQTPLEALMREHLLALEVQNYSEFTVRGRSGHIGFFLDWLKDRGIVEPVEVTRPVLESYQRYLFHYRKPAGREHPQQQRRWKRFQKMEALPTKDQRAVIRLINSLAGAGHAHAEAS